MGGRRLNHRIVVSRQAQRYLSRLDPDTRQRLERAVETLAESPRPPGSIRLAATGEQWRLRVGDYRIIYSIDDDSLEITILRTGHRRDVYRRF